MKLRAICALGLLGALVGCATPANIPEGPDSKIQSPAYTGKTINYDLLYKQPKSGKSSSDTQLDYLPVSAHKLSYESEMSFENIDDVINNWLPVGMASTKSVNSDYKLNVKVSSPLARGPSYADFHFFETWYKNVFTLGFAPSYYEIVADYDVEYQLLKNGSLVYSQNYEIRKSVDHQRGDFTHMKHLRTYSSKLFKSTLADSMNDFFAVAQAKLR